MSRDKLKFLLVQIRDLEQVRLEELQSFAQFSDISLNNIDVLNVFDTPQFDAQIVEKYDAVFVGGASEASVLEPENYPFLNDAVNLLQHCLKIEKPVFASCFGFQLAVVALGGEIVRDERDFEIGTLPISLTPEAAQDPILKHAPNPFLAVSVHRERAPTLPDNCTLLAYTDACPHAFKVDGKPFWGFQFHPEVDKKVLVERLTVFSEKYTENSEHLKRVLTNAQETPESNDLPRMFVDFLLEQA
ncbi:MAG: type 1 glutamine amidotransferase [Alteromonadaceae bacterium]|nr:type 1 glutamine amidotransferase [Alteromonadaceae bacterium]